MRAHQVAAFRTAVVITADAAEAEDAAQEAFVKAYNSLGRFRSGSPFRPWLLTIVANEARNRRKAANRRAGLGLRLAAERWTADAEEAPEAAAEAAERRAELLEAVGELSEDHRVVISCRYFLGFSEEETAAVLGCSRGTVKSRLSRAVARLRQKLREEKDAGQR